MITPGTGPDLGTTIERCSILRPYLTDRHTARVQGRAHLSSDRLILDRRKRASGITGVVNLPFVAFASGGAEIRGTISAVPVAAASRIRSTFQESE